jgi:hypothetical protein
LSIFTDHLSRAIETPSAIFQTVSEGQFCELRLYGVLGSSA